MSNAEFVIDAPASKLPILAAFCCYNPELNLEKNVLAASSVCEKVYVIDDGSPDPHRSAFEFVQLLSNVFLVVKDQNLGIADSFNVGLAKAKESSLPYYLTFDQDTVVDEDQIRTLFASMKELSDQNRRVGVIGPGHILNESYVGTSNERYRCVPEVIQSGGLFSVDALLTVGGADESLVIDAVDTDICMRLSAGKWGVYVDNSVHLVHSIGSGRHLWFFGRSIAVTNHSPLRRYYMTRNRLYTLSAHYRGNKMWALVSLRRLVVSSILAITIETHRRQKLVAVTAGLRDFLRKRRGKATVRFDFFG